MENNSAKPKVHGLITSSGNQLYLNPFQHHSPTLIVRVWKQTLHRSSSWSPASSPHPKPSSVSQWSLFLYFLSDQPGQAFLSLSTIFILFGIAHSKVSVIFSMAPLHSCVQSPPCSADFSGASSQCCLLLSYELLCCSFILSSLISHLSSDSLQDGIFQCWLSSPSSVYSSLLLLGPTSGNVC